MTAATCRVCGKPNPRSGKYCSQDCANEARRSWHKAHPGGNQPSLKTLRAGALRSAQQQRVRRRRERERIFEPRQETPGPGLYQLPPRNPAVVILPPRPAPVKRYADTRRPCEFQDDLSAIADHGSPATAAWGLGALRLVAA